MKNTFAIKYDLEEILHFKTLCKIFNITVAIDNFVVNGKVKVVLEGDVDDFNKFNKQFAQYLEYRHKLKKYKR